MERHYKLEMTDSQMLTHNSEEEVLLSDEYAKYRKEFLAMNSKLQSMLDRN